MTAEDILALRKGLKLTQRQLAEALKIDVDTVRRWEREEAFPTRSLVEALGALRERPPPRKPAPKGASGPYRALAEPGFPVLLRKLLAHPRLRAEAERLAEAWPDPADDPEEST
jgi:transcriptional regulator with XRE-family HTH domain